MNVGLSGQERSQIQSRFSVPEIQTLWSGDFALTNDNEFFAEMSQAYFCANPEISSFNHTQGVNCASELQAHDPVTYDLIHSIYGGSADLR